MKRELACKNLPAKRTNFEALGKSVARAKTLGRHGYDTRPCGTVAISVRYRSERSAAPAGEEPSRWRPIWEMYEYIAGPAASPIIHHRIVRADNPSFRHRCSHSQARLPEEYFIA